MLLRLSLLITLLLASCGRLPSGTIQLALGPLQVRVPIGSRPAAQAADTPVDASRCVDLRGWTDTTEVVEVRELLHGGEHELQRLVEVFVLDLNGEI